MGGKFGTLFCRLRSCTVDHMSLMDSARCLLCQDMDCILHVYLRSVFSVVCNRAAGFRSATSSVAETHIATFCQDASFVLTHLDDFPAALEC